MSEKVTTTIRINSDTKKAATEVFRALGLDFSKGVDIYLNYVARNKRIPFSLDLAEDKQRGEND